MADKVTDDKVNDDTINDYNKNRNRLREDLWREANRIDY